MTPTPHPSRVGDGDDRVLTEATKLVLSAAESALNAEYQYSERLEAKARQQATMAATWFAIVQASAAAVISSTKPASGWILAVCVIAILAAGCLIDSYLKLSNVWKPLDEELIQPPELIQWDTDARENPREFAHQLVLHYANVLQQRRKNTRSRSKGLLDSQRLWQVALAVAFIELGVAFAARVSS